MWHCCTNLVQPNKYYGVTPYGEQEGNYFGPSFNWIFVMCFCGYCGINDAATKLCDKSKMCIGKEMSANDEFPHLK